MCVLGGGGGGKERGVDTTPKLDQTPPGFYVCRIVALDLEKIHACLDFRQIKMIHVKPMQCPTKTDQCGSLL